MVLTAVDRVRWRVKEAEFASRAPLPRFLYRACRMRDPYLPADHAHRMIFFHVPKAAGTSLRRTLYGHAAFHVPPARYMSFDPAAFAQYFKFAFVRNPWSRVFSAYGYLAKRVGSASVSPDHRWANAMLAHTPDFGAFVDKLQEPRFCRAVRRYVHFRDQLDWISLPSGRHDPPTLCVDFLGRYETLGADFAALRGRLALDVDLPKLKAGDGACYREAYTARRREIVGEIWHRDVTVLGYRFED